MRTVEQFFVWEFTIVLIHWSNFKMWLFFTDAEDVIGWARNMAFNSKRLQVRDGKLFFEKEW